MRKKRTQEQMYDLLEVTAAKVSELSENVIRLQDDMSAVCRDMDVVNRRLSSIATNIEANMVTKDYLDRKFAEYSSEEQLKDWKHHQSLARLLENKKILNRADVSYLQKNRFLKPSHG